MISFLYRVIENIKAAGEETNQGTILGGINALKTYDALEDNWNIPKNYYKDVKPYVNANTREDFFKHIMKLYVSTIINIIKKDEEESSVKETKE